VVLDKAVIAVISFFRGEREREFVPADVSVAENVARLAELAARNARLYEESRRAARSREDVVAIVSHDLRSPIASVQLAARTMQRVLNAGAPLDDARLQRLSGQIVRATEAMDRLVQDLLDASKMDAGTFRIQRVRTDVGELLSEVGATFAPLAAERVVELKIVTLRDPIVAEIDRERMGQVISNLVGNALKFTPAGGHVTVGASMDGSDLVVEVADDGLGVRSEDLPHLFERYWQPRESRGPKGVGLGLFICKGVVEAHGGVIQVTSAPGRGARFRCVVPVPEPRSSGPREEDLAGARIALLR
jgi:signal transduction histidine kinase